MKTQKFTKGTTSFDLCRWTSPAAARQAESCVAFAPGLARAQHAGYVHSLASKKGAIGIGLPVNPLRRKPQSIATGLRLFVRTPFWHPDDEAQAWPVRLSGFPLDQLVALLRLIGLEATIFANRICLTVAMTKSSSALAQPRTTAASAALATYSALFAGISAGTPPLAPYMRPESITGKTLSYCGVDLLPVLSGYQPGKGFDGETLDHRLQTIHINRQIEAVKRAIGREHCELETVISMTSRYMGQLDTQRSEMGLGASCAKSGLKGEDQDPHAPISNSRTFSASSGTGISVTGCTCAES